MQTHLILNMILGLKLIKLKASVENSKEKYRSEAINTNTKNKLQIKYAYICDIYFPGFCVSQSLYLSDFTFVQQSCEIQLQHADI